MDHHVREAVAPLHVVQVEPGEDVRVDGVLHDDALGEHAERLDLVEQAPAVEDAGAVGRDLQTGADLTERLPVSGHDELAELSSTFNGMLDELEDAFDTQQRFVDDAGHELRTPITVIRGHLDLMGDDPEERRGRVEQPRHWPW